MTTDYQNELVDRCAPRWAWEVIDETLAADALSSAFDPTLRQQIQLALEAMIQACAGETICEECGESVEEIIGCPDGAEICQDCFDAGHH